MNTTLSQSAIDTFRRCARRYYLRYVRLLDWPAPLTSSELDFEQAMRRGEQFHLLVQQHALGLDVSRTVEATGDEVLQHWWSSWVGHAQRLLPATSTHRFTEIELAVAVDDVTLVAKFDLVVADERGDLHIFDWKTGVPRSRERLAAAWQSIVYPYVATERGGQMLGLTEEGVDADRVHLTYWYVREPDDPVQLAYDPAAHEQGRQRLERVVADIVELEAHRSEDAFERTADESQCRHCPYRSYCERGRDADPGAEPDLMPDAEELMRERAWGEDRGDV